MSNIRITIDGDTVMDSDPGDWSLTPPDIDSLKLKATGPGKPWGLAVMSTIADAAPRALAGHTIGNTTITVTTTSTGWTMDVDHEAAP
jgi:hypothetical protein